MPETKVRPVAIWLLTLVALAASFGFLGLRLVGLGDGTHIPFYTDAWSADGVAITAPGAPSGGLRTDDIVTGVAGRSLTAWLDHVLDPTVDRAALDGQTVTYAIRRAGADLEVTVQGAAHDVGPLASAYWSAIVFVITLQLVAGYVLWRRPQAPAARALALAAVGVSGSTIPWFLGLEAGDLARALPFLLYAATAGGIYMLLWPAGAIHLPLALTSTAGPGRRALTVAYALPLGAYLVVLVAARLAAPSWLAWIGSWSVAQGLVIVPTLVVGAGLTLHGFRRAPPEQRARLRWALLGGGLAVAGSVGLLFLPQLIIGRPLVPWTAIGLIALPLPLGIGAAILRYRLLDIEVVVNRALVYGGATAAIVAVYAVVVSLLVHLVGIQTEFSAALLATGIAAVAALPVRDALQRAVDRLMFGDRDDPYRGLDRLGQRLDAAIDPQEVPAVIVRTVAESLRLPWVALQIGRGDAVDGAARTIEHGHRPTGEPVRLSLVHGSEPVGELLVAPRAPSEPLSNADLTLLGALARQAGTAVHALGLTLDLIDSRARLLAAREEERQRIRRDLHDGLGPTLAAIGLRAEVAADLVASQPQRAQGLLDELRTEAQAGIAEIRRLVDALRPSALDELGLLGALEGQAQRLGPLPAFVVSAPQPLPGLPEAVEEAAYRIAAEAMTNAARHAEAGLCRVQLRALAEPAPVLEIEVSDDGRGLPAEVRPGIGLASMQTRAAELGGTCTVSSSPRGGTRVLAHLPLGRTPPAPLA